jgi:hypothetical protein
MPALTDGAVVAAIEAAARRHANTDPDVRDRLGELANTGADYAQSIAPVGEGDYQDGIEGDTVFVDGAWRGRIAARDWKSRFIEYGTVDTPKFGVLRRTREHLQGE